MHGTTGVRNGPLAVARAGFIAVATVLALAASAAPPADAPPAPTGETRSKVAPTPPSAEVDASDAVAADDFGSDKKSGRHRHAVIRVDSDPDFESLKDAVSTAPWIVGLVFLVVGSIFLTPVILLVGIVWYKLRKTRMQNEALLKLAESGVMPPAQAIEAVSTGVMPAAGTGQSRAGTDTSGIAGIAGAGDTASIIAAATAYEQAVRTRRRQVWSDLRKGVLMSAVGLSVVVYSAAASGSPNWLGLVLLFVGIGYLALWWLEDRQISQHAASDLPNQKG